MRVGIYPAEKYFQQKKQSKACWVSPPASSRTSKESPAQEQDELRRWQEAERPCGALVAAVRTLASVRSHWGH